MHRQLAAIALCMFAQGALAQCVAASATVNPTTATPVVAATAHPVRAAAATQEAHAPRAELIKAAAASTRDDAPPPVRSAAPAATDDSDHPRRGSTAMLLAALALMSGIALRRFGARDA